MDDTIRVDPSIFQRYLSGQMNGEEKAAFEGRLALDSGLQEELEWYRAFFSALEEKEDLRLKEMLRNSTSRKDGIAKRRLLYGGVARWVAVAGLLLIIAAVYWIFVASSQSLQKNREGDFFAPAPLVLSDISEMLLQTRGNEQTSRQEGRLLDSLYNNGDYGGALGILTNLPEEAATLFYRANCLLALDRPAAAILILQEVETFKDSNFSIFAQWYLAIAYFKTGNEAMAKQYVQKAIDSDWIHLDSRQQPRRLLEMLE